MLLLAVFLLLLTAAQIDRTVIDAAHDVRGIVAHRGSSADRPENTMAAYQRAIENGATGIEIDLRLTKDGHLVSLHDDSVDRTTNGSGKVGSITLAEISKLDAGSWFDARYRDERIPTFREILVLARGRVDVFLDLKEEGTAYVSQIIDEARQYGEPKRIIAGVRSAEQALQFRRDLPEARQVGLIPSPEDIEPFVRSGVPVIRLSPDWLPNPRLADRVRDAGAELHLTVEHGSLDELLPVLKYRPVSLFTDDPARTRLTLEELRSRH